MVAKHDFKAKAARHDCSLRNLPRRGNCRRSKSQQTSRNKVSPWRLEKSVAVDIRHRTRKRGRKGIAHAQMIFHVRPTDKRWRAWRTYRCAGRVNARHCECVNHARQTTKAYRQKHDAPSHPNDTSATGKSPEQTALRLVPH